MKVRMTIKRIVTYLFAMVFSIIFGLFLNANVGWFILITLILAPVISVFFAWLSSRLITVSCQMQEALLSKGDDCTMAIMLQNRSIFPTPPIALTLTNEAGVRSEDKELLATVMSLSTREFRVNFKAKMCGQSTVGVRELRVTDYLGLFSFTIKNLDYASLQKKAAVIPNFAEISARDDNLLKVMQTSLHMDDSDDTVEAQAVAFGGFPGYDNREYVPGDPLKRINWKQSAKRNRLLVRLDDEMASKAVNVVLDSVFDQDAVDVQAMRHLQQYNRLMEDEIIPKLAEDAVENALGLMQILIRQNYTVNFYVMEENKFREYEILDEIDLEAVRLELANYSFYSEAVQRLPKDNPAFSERVGLFSTPNSYEEAYAALEEHTDALHTTIYSVPEEARKQGAGEGSVFLEAAKEKPEKKSGIKEKIAETIKQLVIPYLLAVLLSVSVFSVFEVPVLSYWTLAQVVMCALIMAFCEYVNKHRVIGSMLMVLLIMGLLNVASRLVFADSYGLNYMHWFLSGGESVETTTEYLVSLLLAFTVFFAMVAFYFTRVLYRTSFLVLISLIPFVVFVKVMQDIIMEQVVFVTVLNIAAFLVNSRTQKDRGKRIVGYVEGLVSVGVYAVILVLIGLALPEAETKYYYMFENAFLGGNISEEVPEEYSQMSEYSGNADGFNQLNNRKLYEISMLEPGQTVYFRRQTFDLYDFENDRWYPIDKYSTPVYSGEEWADQQESLSLSLLIEALQCAEEYEPEILAKYGIPDVETGNEDTLDSIYVDTMNFPSEAYITPPDAISIIVYRNGDRDQENTYVSPDGIFQRKEGFLQDNIEYSVDYYAEDDLRRNFLTAGWADYDSEESLQLLAAIKEVLVANAETEYTKVVEGYIEETRAALEYKVACEANNNLIPESVRNLALEITKDCVYDWEKAEALQNYFKSNDFVYDLSYNAPDDSVEYFLFEGKTGTCSDYASAYVLMARSLGLTVRYTEGFIPKEEYDGGYVIRTNCGHAYPEVFIPNVGYVVYEATQPARYNSSSGLFGSGALAYVITVIVRVVLVFTLVSAVIITILFLHLIAAPTVREKYFAYKIKKASPESAVVMFYERIMRKHAKKIVPGAMVSTPYEYAEEFEERLHYDISELIYLVEKVAYAGQKLSEPEKEKAGTIYAGAKGAVQEWRKNNTKVLKSTKVLFRRSRYIK